MSRTLLSDQLYGQEHLHASLQGVLLLPGCQHRAIVRYVSSALQGADVLWHTHAEKAANGIAPPPDVGHAIESMLHCKVCTRTAETFSSGVRGVANDLGMQSIMAHWKIVGLPANAVLVPSCNLPTGPSGTHVE